MESETLCEERVLSSVLLPGPGVGALHASISMRVHIALKATSGRGESETDCISLEGMFVFVTLRLTEGVCFALVRVNERGRGEGRREKRVSAGTTSCVGPGQKDQQSLTLRKDQRTESQRA